MVINMPDKKKKTSCLVPEKLQNPYGNVYFTVRNNIITLLV